MLDENFLTKRTKGSENPRLLWTSQFILRLLIFNKFCITFIKIFKTSLKLLSQRRMLGYLRNPRRTPFLLSSLNLSKNSKNSHKILLRKQMDHKNRQNKKIHEKENFSTCLKENEEKFTLSHKLALTWKSFVIHMRNKIETLKCKQYLCMKKNPCRCNFFSLSIVSHSIINNRLKIDVNY